MKISVSSVRPRSILFPLSALLVSGCLQGLGTNSLASSEAAGGDASLVDRVVAQVPMQRLSARSRVDDVFTPLPAPGARVRYSILPDVEVSKAARSKLSRIADNYYRDTGELLVVTSGTRDAEDQAGAMYTKLQLGGSLVALYKNKEAALELQRVYETGRARGRTKKAVVSAMASTIRRQMAQGTFISSHLRAGAVDIRNRTMNAAKRHAFQKAVDEAGGVKLLEEAKPPHFHLQLL